MWTNTERESTIGFQQQSKRNNIIRVYKKLVTYLKRRRLASRLTATVVQDIETRWNSKLANFHSAQCVIGEIRVLYKNDIMRTKRKAITLC